MQYTLNKLLEKLTKTIKFIFIKKCSFSKRTQKTRYVLLEKAHLCFNRSFSKSFYLVLVSFSPLPAG